MPLPAILRRLRESVSASTEPQLQRGREIEESAPSQAERDTAAGNGDAFSDGKYPITSQEQADNAWGLRNSSKDHSEEEVTAHIRKQVKKHGLKMPGATDTREAVALRVRLREVTLTKSEDGVYEATIITEGPGNPEDGNYYTAAALREAVNQGLFEGLRAYLNHPTPDESQQRPERDVRFLAGHFRETSFVDGTPASVRGKFVPGGMEKDKVRNLIESAIDSPPGKPLIGISIDGYGYTPDTQTIGGRTYSMVREFVQLGSADLVTQTATGGRFHRRLREALNPSSRPPDGGGDDPGGRKMKPAELQDKVKAAVAKLSEAAGLDESKATEANDMVTAAIATLRECETATIDPVVKIEEKRIEVPVAATEAEKDQLAVKLREATTKLQESDKATADEKARADTAESKLQEASTAKLAAKVLREAEAPASSARSWFDAVAACEDEAAMKRLVEVKMAERDEIVTEIRESYGLVEGAGRRETTTTTGGSGGDLLDTLGLDRDEYVPAA